MSGQRQLIARITGDQPDWSEHGLCKGSTSLFYPDGDPGDVAEAKAVCRTCSVREPCLEYALANGEKYGVWGGTSERERRKLRRTWRLRNVV